MPPILLTDAGLVSALGCGVEETARRLRAADVSGMKPLAGVLADGESTFFGFARLPDAAFASAPFRVAALVDEAARQLEPAVAALSPRIPRGRIGVVIGTSNSTMEEFTDDTGKIDMSYPVRRMKERLSLGGPAWSVSTACSSSAKVFSSARRLIDEGICDAVVAGGADAFTRVVVNGFHALEAVSPNLTRPLAADRDGINLGEGAAAFLMRRAKPGERGIALLGVGESSDAHHLTAPDPEGRGAEAAMRAALADAGLPPSSVDYVNLHGTGTVYNDAMECAAVRRVFGDATPCGSTKPLTGHALGAAGAIEAALCWIALERGDFAPPHAAAEIDRSLAPFPVPTTGNAIGIRTAISNSFAFGGSNASILLGVA